MQAGGGGEVDVVDQGAVAGGAEEGGAEGADGGGEGVREGLEGAAEGVHFLVVSWGRGGLMGGKRKRWDLMMC